MSICAAGGKLKAAGLEDDSLVALENELVVCNDAPGWQKNVWNLCRETAAAQG